MLLGGNHHCGDSSVEVALAVSGLFPGDKAALAAIGSIWRRQAGSGDDKQALAGSRCAIIGGGVLGRAD
jgi:hypothetical protein